MTDISKYPRWVRWISWIPHQLTNPIVHFVVWMEFHKSFPEKDGGS